jgi:hypothetical protein
MWARLFKSVNQIMSYWRYHPLSQSMIRVSENQWWRTRLWHAMLPRICHLVLYTDSQRIRRPETAVPANRCGTRTPGKHPIFSLTLIQGTNSDDRSWALGRKRQILSLLLPIANLQISETVNPHSRIFIEILAWSRGRSRADWRMWSDFTPEKRVLTKSILKKFDKLCQRARSRRKLLFRSLHLINQEFWWKCVNLDFMGRISSTAGPQVNIYAEPPKLLS